MKSSSAYIGVTLLLLALVTCPLHAQEGGVSGNETKTPQEIALEKAENQKKIAEAELAEAKAKKALKELDLPATETKGLEGTITMGENTGYYAELLAIGALKDAAMTIAKEIPGQGKLKIIATTAFDLSEQQVLWSVLNARISDMRRQAQALIEKHPEDGSSVNEQESLLAAIGAAPAILGGIADIAKFFKTDRSLKGRAVTISDNALLVAVASALTTKQHTVLIETFGSPTKPLLLSNIEELLADRARLAQHIKAIRNAHSATLASLKQSKARIVEVKKSLGRNPAPTGDELQSLKERLAEAEDSVAALQPLEDKLTDVEQEFETLVKHITDGVETLLSRPSDGKSLLESVATADLIKSNSDAHILALELTSKGGEFETTKKVFRTGKISYLGGVAISYLLLDKDFNIVAANVVPQRKGAKFKSLNEEER